MPLNPQQEVKLDVAVLLKQIGISYESFIQNSKTEAAPFGPFRPQTNRASSYYTQHEFRA
jgi:hypothetical protein